MYLDQGARGLSQSKGEDSGFRALGQARLILALSRNYLKAALVDSDDGGHIIVESSGWQWKIKTEGLTGNAEDISD